MASGRREPYRPYNRGFDETLWHPNGGMLFPDKKTGFLRNLYRGADPVEIAEYSTDAFGREACEFIDRHQREPFFLYLSFVPPHWPMQAKPEHLAQYAHIRDLHRRTMLGMMASLDENVGRVLAKLRETKLEENTLVFFLSDNGGPTGAPREAARRGFRIRTEHLAATIPAAASRATCWKAASASRSWCNGKAASRPARPRSAGDQSRHPAHGAGRFRDRAQQFARNERSWTASTCCPISPARAASRRTNRSSGDSVFRRTSPRCIAGRSDRAIGSWSRTGANRLALYNLADDIGETNNLADEHPEQGWRHACRVEAMGCIRTRNRDGGRTGERCLALATPGSTCWTKKSACNASETIRRSFQHYPPCHRSLHARTWPIRTTRTLYSGSLPVFRHWLQGAARPMFIIRHC